AQRTRVVAVAPGRCRVLEAALVAARPEQIARGEQAQRGERERGQAPRGPGHCGQCIPCGVLTMLRGGWPSAVALLTAVGVLLALAFDAGGYFPPAYLLAGAVA